ncbi:hypothetical protein [Nocardia wallacei]|uniref:hypothetical protein n=1 Tax=Nocardia wallacei TaxID=480035 RepID=UPI00245420DF|nr:hypothetical protein [Nocardia wallacei]
MRQDISRHATDEHVARIRELAAARHWTLCGVLIAPDDGCFRSILARFGEDRIDTLLVPSVLHVTGWLVEVRYHAEVVTLEPFMRWPRHSAQDIIARSGPTGTAAGREQVLCAGGHVGVGGDALWA